MQLSRKHLVIALVIVSAFVTGVAAARTAPISTAPGATANASRMAECINELADAMNSRDLRYQYGTVEYRYDFERDLCLYRGNRVGRTAEGLHYLEKFIVDAFTDTALSQYVEVDGQALSGDLDAFSAMIDDLFPDEQNAPRGGALEGL